MLTMVSLGPEKSMMPLDRVLVHGNLALSLVSVAVRFWSGVCEICLTFLRNTRHCRFHFDGIAFAWQEFWTPTGSASQ